MSRKNKFVAHVITYGKEGKVFSDTEIICSSRQQINVEFQKCVSLHLLVGFSFISRVDLVVDGHCIYVFADVRSIINKNVVLPLNP